MIGNVIVCKPPYRYDNSGEPLEQAYRVFQLTEPHEAGEIIDNYYLIVNENTWLDRIEKYKFKTGYFVKGIDIRYFDMFETDINYDNREDLKRYGIQMKEFNNQSVITYLYKYVGTNYPEGFKFI